jgi:hypothetical protein
MVMGRLCILEFYSLKDLLAEMPTELISRKYHPAVINKYLPVGLVS